MNPHHVLRSHDDDGPSADTPDERGAGAREAGAPHIMVLKANIDSGSNFWRASRRLERCGPAEVQHDGSVFMPPRRDGDEVCREVTAVNVATGSRAPAIIVRLASNDS